MENLKKKLGSRNGQKRPKFKQFVFWSKNTEVFFIEKKEKQKSDNIFQQSLLVLDFLKMPFFRSKMGPRIE